MSSSSSDHYLHCCPSYRRSWKRAFTCRLWWAENLIFITIISITIVIIIIITITLLVLISIVVSLVTCGVADLEGELYEGPSPVSDGGLQTSAGGGQQSTVPDDGRVRR